MVPRSADVVVIGAGIVGAACARALAVAGMRVVVLERGTIAAGSTSRGEGNILASDKPPGPELDLARLSVEQWLELGDELEYDFELERKGSVIVTTGSEHQRALVAMAQRQREGGIQALPVDPSELSELEPGLRPCSGGAFYPDDLQIQPIKATAALLADARHRGAELKQWTPVTGFAHGVDGSIAGVRTPTETVSTGLVVNAAGIWSPEIADLAGSHLRVLPRRGYVLVTEPLPPLIIHKVFAASYLDTVASSSEHLQVSTVVEGTASGTILVGASRELVGLDERANVDAWRQLAASAIDLFPALGRARMIRVYHGFRPFSPDGLPLIGPDQHVSNLWHASGHEGAGIGLAAGTAAAIAAGIGGSEMPLDLGPFSPSRKTVSILEGHD
jgi:D-hydroxyproline dehydrogenase subunit beta